MNESVRRPNPYDFTREVANPQHFAGRKQELEIIRENIAGLGEADTIATSLAIVGERRVGKTSLLLRVQEACTQLRIFPVLITLTNTVAQQPWEFWREVLDSVIDCGKKAGILDYGRLLRFSPQRLSEKGDNQSRSLVPTQDLRFGEFYIGRGVVGQVPPIQVILEDFNTLIQCVLKNGQNGLLLMIDEAHLIASSNDVQQQIRQLLRDASNVAVIFSGESILASVFNDPTQPLYAQARLLQLRNFATVDQVLESILLPLAEEERALVSPMTVDYIARLSQGKPNQVRLICYSIYGRYAQGHQDDLNISIETLDDIMDDIESAYGTDYPRGQQVEAIRKLTSSDLECLHNMTRYIDWMASDIVELDESFRGEVKSQQAILRRRRLLEEKRTRFVEMGLMRDDPHRFVLAGDEFLYLYLRFYYEVRKYGELSRRLELGKRPLTLFGEKTEKLARAIMWELRRSADIVNMTLSPRDISPEDIGRRVRDRYSVLQQLMNNGVKPTREQAELLSECFSICELVSKPGQYHLFVFYVRNLENPRDTLRAELYFPETEEPLLIRVETLALIKKQAEDSRISVEGIDDFVVDLPNLQSLLERIGLPALDELTRRLDGSQRWWVQSVQRVVQDDARRNELRSDGQADDDKDDNSPWTKLYEAGDADGADKAVSEKLLNESKRPLMARMHNDRGYIRYGLRQEFAAKTAEEDLKRAFDLHFVHLPLTLLNSSVIDIGQRDYNAAILKIEDALFLTLGREEIDAG